MFGSRRSIRLKNYDYTQEGAYYVTICVNNRKCFFGDVFNGGMVLNDSGKMVDKWWRELPQKYNMIEIDEYKIMPNHLHGIIVIVENNENGDVGADLCVRPINGKNNGINDNDAGNVQGRTHRCALTPVIGMIVRWFKTMSTNEYIKNVKINNWPSFKTRLWQRNFYEHVVRDGSDFVRIREYIVNNPAHWEKDEYYS